MSRYVSGNLYRFEASTPEDKPAVAIPQVVDFSQAVRNEERHERVGTFLAQNHGTNQAAIGTARNHLTFAGSVAGKGQPNATHDIRGDTPEDTIILTGNKFPGLLIKATRLDEKRAIGLAADTVVVHGILVAQTRARPWITRKQAIPPKIRSQDFNPTLWHPEFRVEGSERPLPYRFSGAIAMQMAGIDPEEIRLSLPEDRVLPPDLAGLANSAPPDLVKAAVLRYLK